MIVCTVLMHSKVVSVQFSDLEMHINKTCVLYSHYKLLNIVLYTIFITFAFLLLTYTYYSTVTI